MVASVPPTGAAHLAKIPLPGFARGNGLLHNQITTDGELAYELQAIGGELEQLLENERDEAIKLERRFAEDYGAMERVLQSVQEAKAIGQWRNTRFNVFEVLGRTRREQAHSNLLAWLLDPAEAHGLGDAFLREFMAKAIGMEPPSTRYGKYIITQRIYSDTKVQIDC